MNFPVYFNSEIVAQLPVYPTLNIERQLMNADKISPEIANAYPLDLPIGCRILFNNHDYTVNTIPNVNKVSDRRYEYSLTFESDLYRLFDKIMEHLNNMTFQYLGSPVNFAHLIVDNINDIDTGWTVGVCDDAEEIYIDFSDQTCRSALDTIAQAFKFEWDVEGKEIRFVKQVGNVTTHTFSYGINKGLYNLTRSYRSDKNIVTRAFGRGSTRNLPKNYRGGLTELGFEGLSIEKNTNIYKKKDGIYRNEEIYPKIEGHVTGFSAFDPDSNYFYITDTTLTFNINDNKSSETPKISFLTGELQGQEFEIVDFNNTTKTIKIKVFADSNNNKLPRLNVGAHIGDTYTLFDMYMPAASVAAAEALLKTKTQEWLDENSIASVIYTLELDPLYARDNNIILNKGDKIKIVDVALGIDALIRVNSTSYPVYFPEQVYPETKINITLSNDIVYTQVQRLLKADITNQKEIKIVNRTNAEKARMNSLNLRTLQGRIFNPDGTLFNGPESLVAGMASFGYDSQNLNLNGVVISANFGANPNSFSISSGKLIHYIYKIPLGYIWNLPLHTWTGLNPAKFYYVYAKCSKTALSGTCEISETGVGVNDIPGYYAFNLGILYEVNSDGYRVFQSTKGVTTIVGDQITSGLIQDVSGQNYINLTNGKFNMGTPNSGIDWDVTTPDTLTIRGAVASKVIQVGSGGVINARISGITDPINPSQSVRFAAGTSDEFKVLDNGYMAATSGMIGNWQITDGGIKNDDGSAYIIARDSSEGGAQAIIGTNVFPATFGGIGVALFENTKNNPYGTNYGAVFKASGGLNNIAASFDGRADFNGPAIFEGQIAVGPDKILGKSQEVQYQGPDRDYKMIFINGLYVGNYAV